MDIPRTLLVSNDFPPKVGGIQRTLEALWRVLPADRISVVAPDHEGAAEWDAAAPYPVYREKSRFIWPTRAFRSRLEKVIAETGAEVVVFGDAFPLAWTGPWLAGRGTPYVILAHGFDYWLSIVPGAHSVYKRMSSKCSTVAVCSGWIAKTVRTAVPEDVPVTVLHPGGDIAAFRPDLDTTELRARYGIGARPLVVCVSRLVKRKGQDVLIKGMEQVRREVPDAALLIVGDGPYRADLEAMANEVAPAGSVFFSGQVAEAELPLHYAMADVFAMPCRTRLAGFEVEGWGNVFIEAAACGKPVIVGDSGGAKESLVDGETGILVDGTDVGEVASAVSKLLADRELARRMGEAGRARVERDHTWEAVASRLSVWLNEAVSR